MNKKPRWNVAEVDNAEALEIVFTHYDLRWPNGHGNRVINCPVHNDRHASASVNTGTGLWQCFACQASGDAYNLIMEKEGVGFTDAVERFRDMVDKSGGKVRRSTAGESGSIVPRRPRDRRDNRRYIPSWMGKQP